jgi:hypothetical protein
MFKEFRDRQKTSIKGTALALIFLTLSLIFWLVVKLVIPKMFGKEKPYTQGVEKRVKNSEQR